MLVKNMLKKGLLPLPVTSQIIKEKNMQIKGQDIFIKGNALTHSNKVLQVKCDFPGGRDELGGTGNLFLQIEEINPYKLY